MPLEDTTISQQDHDQTAPDMTGMTPQLTVHDPLVAAPPALIDMSEGAELNVPSDTITCAMEQVSAVPLETVNPVIQLLGSLMTAFSMEPPYESQLVNIAASSLFDSVGAQLVYIPQGAVVDPRNFANLLIINDDGLLRVVIVLWNGEHWIFIYRDIDGIITAFISDFETYCNLRAELIIASQGGQEAYPALTILSLILSTPLSGIDTLWQAALDVYRLNQEACQAACPAPRVVERRASASTRRRPERGVRIGEHKSESQRLYERLMRILDDEEQETLIPQVIETLVMPNMVQQFLPLLASEHNESLSAYDYGYQLGITFFSEYYLTSVMDASELMIVINPPVCSEPPLIIFLTLFGASATLNLFAFNNFDGLVDEESSIESMTILQNRFWDALRQLICRLPDNYTIRVYERNDPIGNEGGEDNEGGAANQDQ